MNKQETALSEPEKQQRKKSPEYRAFSILDYCIKSEPLQRHHLFCLLYIDIIIILSNSF
jgi:hypothetical protein